MSRCKRIGDIGEANVIAELLTHKDIYVSKPIGDNCPYDLLIDIHGKIYRAQVKTTEKLNKGRMVFYLCSFNSKKRLRRVYSKNDIDLFLFYCMENKYLGFAWGDEIISQKSITITTKKKEELSPSVLKIVRFADDFDLRKRIKELK